MSGNFTPPTSTAPGSYSSAGFASPSMTGYGYGYYGGQAPVPEGGYYNQMSQSMAGPSYAPVGSQWTQLAPGQAWNSPAGYGQSGSGSAKGAKGSTPTGATSTSAAPTGQSSAKGGMTPLNQTQTGGNTINPAFNAMGGAMAPPSDFASVYASQHPGFGNPYYTSGPTGAPLNPYSGITQAPQPGQPLHSLGTGIYGQPTAPVQQASTGSDGGALSNPLYQHTTLGPRLTGGQIMAGQRMPLVM